MNARVLLPLMSVLVWAFATAADPLRIVIVGDSTVSEYPADGPERGWGHYIDEQFQQGSAAVTNLAIPGRSTKSFIQEGRWEQALQLKPVYVFIQFGHNDSHDPMAPEATDAATDYKQHLRQYIDEARAIGATPIFVTPMVRRTFDEQGKFTEEPLKGMRPLGSYAKAMREVGAEKHVGVIDLYASSKALAESLGKAGNAELANRPSNITHFNEKGARAMADLVIRELPRVVPDLARCLRGTPEQAKTH